MAKKKTKSKKPATVADNSETKLGSLLRHYARGVQDTDVRRTRKNGWDAGIDAVMNRVPNPWPFAARIMDPRIQTTITEKSARLLNSKLQGRLVPRGDSNMVGAKINNQLLDFQWDEANDGGPMIEKVGMCDLSTRTFGISYALTYWDNQKDGNEMKPWDVRDIFIDPTLTHIRSAKGNQWVQLREWTTKAELEARGFTIPVDDETPNSSKSTAYISEVLSNRNMDQFTYDPANPRIEVVTEWTCDEEVVFLPKHHKILRQRKNPYKHGRIPVAMLRYYPLPDDIVGQSEVETALPLSRAINWFLSGFADEMNQAIRPPHKVLEGQVRMETIEYGPNAIWIMNSPGAIEEVPVGVASIQAFNNIYPVLVAALNTAMGSQSIGVSNGTGPGSTGLPSNGPKTATEVNQLGAQQNTRDQYNQLYLAEFLKDIMMMWVENNKQYLFDDPTKTQHVMRIIGRDEIQEFKNLGLADMDIPPELMNELQSQVSQGNMSQLELKRKFDMAQVPVHPVVMNPEQTDPSKMQVKPKLDVHPNGQEANLYVEPDDCDGFYDYIPDVKSMAAGAGTAQQQALQQAMQAATNPAISGGLFQAGKRLKMEDLLLKLFTTGGLSDAEDLFEDIPPGTMMPPQRRLTETVAFKDMPPEAQAQLLQSIGINLQSPNGQQGSGNPQPGQAPSPMGGQPGVPGLQGMAPQGGQPPLAPPQQGQEQGQAPLGLQR